MAFTPAQLKSELQTDPRGYGYAAQITAGNHQALADMLNLARTGSNGGPQITIEKPYIMPDELAGAIVFSEYTGGQAAQRQYIDMLMTMSKIPVGTAAVPSNPRTALLAIFTAGSTTRTNLTAIARKDGSRAEELWGAGTVITIADVGTALAS